MSMCELDFRSKSVFRDLIAARDRRQDFVLVVKGRKAEKLFRVVPCYERYRMDWLRSSRWRLGHLLLFAFSALRAPLFWGLCIMADFEAAESNFVLTGQTLRVEFLFRRSNATEN